MRAPVPVNVVPRPPVAVGCATSASRWGRRATVSVPRLMPVASLAAGPVVAGPVVAGPVVAGPVVAGPVVAGHSGAGTAPPGSVEHWSRSPRPLGPAGRAGRSDVRGPPGS